MSKTIVIFDGRYATSIASAAIVLLKNRAAEAVDFSLVNSEKGLKALKTKINKTAEAYVMVDNLGIKPSDGTKLIYLKAQGKKEDRRVIAVWEAQNPGKPAPLMIFNLGAINAPEDRLVIRGYLENAIPTYLSDLAGGDLQKWSRLLEGQQDVGFMNQLASMGQNIADYKDRFGTEDTDKVSAKDLAAAKAELAELGDNAEALRDSEEEVKILESEASTKDESIEKLTGAVESLEGDVETWKGKADKAAESEKEAKELLGVAQTEAKDAKSVVTDKEKELKIVRGDLETAASRLEKAEEGAGKTKETLEGTKKSLTESRKDYDTAQNKIAGLEKDNKTLTADNKKLAAEVKKPTKKK